MALIRVTKANPVVKKWNGLCKPWLSLIQLRISLVLLVGATSKLNCWFSTKNMRTTVAEGKLLVGQRTKIFHSHMKSNPGTDQMVHALVIVFNNN